MPSVWPSVALATTSMPSMPPAPALVSTTTGWPQRLASLSLMARTIRSSELPAGAGTTIFTGRVGQAPWARAGAASTAAARAMSERRIMVQRPRSGQKRRRS